MSSADPTPNRLHLWGIRHHGPGSARSVRRALEALRPDAVVVELPADCEPLLRWIGTETMVPPVAVIGHEIRAASPRGTTGVATNGAARPVGAAFLPLAEFSPEWQAIEWANAVGAAVRAMDLPLARTIGRDLSGGASTVGDPLSALAEVAGYGDAEQWWEDMVEHRGDGGAVFDAVGDAMAAARDRDERGGWSGDPFTLAREAHMRTVLREVLGLGVASVAVVCGAWHVPALAEPWPSAASDRAVVRAWTTAAPRAKVGVAWVPWTHRRLAAATGYGAGVRSPGWYAHVFRHPGDDGLVRWFVEVATLLRGRGIAASPDHLVAASRAATALAALRGRPRPGLAEVRDAAEAVLGAHGGLALIDRDLLVGDRIGVVPDDAPQVPLAADLAAQQRAARLVPEADERTLEIDLRVPTGRLRSVLLHRLRVLGVDWGVVAESRASLGTFRETWTMRWEPEHAVRLVEVSPFGLTVELAAAGVLLDRAHTLVAAASSTASGRALPDLVALLDDALLADLPAVVDPLVRHVEHSAALDPDVTLLMASLEPLARTLRYGDVRGTDAAALRRVVDGMVVRVVAGLVIACRSLDDEGAALMAERLSSVQAALALLDHPARRGEWPAVLSIVAERPDVHGVVHGRATRLLHDGGAWLAPRVSARLSRALSPGTDPAAGAAFVEGLMAGSGLVLVHDRGLLDIVDGWVSSMAREDFDAVVPLLRRTFGAFEVAERRQIGVLLDEAHAMTSATPAVPGDSIDLARAAAGLVTLRQLHGVAT